MTENILTKVVTEQMSISITIPRIDLVLRKKSFIANNNNIIIFIILSFLITFYFSTLIF
jgi:hypothetical protein